jgi:hypothetical protein
MQAAFLHALNDCTPCVRLAAIEALEMTADQCNAQAQAFKALREDCDQTMRTRRAANKATRERPLCNRCDDAGCAECGYGTIVTVDYGYGMVSDCGACGGGGCGVCGGGPFACESCLGKEICKRLQEMAYKQDADGCWIEPVPQIRDAAARLLAWCPPPEPPPVPVPPIDIEGDVIPEGTETRNGAGMMLMPNASGFMTMPSPFQATAYGPNANPYQTPWYQQYQQPAQGVTQDTWSESQYPASTFTPQITGAYNQAQPPASSQSWSLQDSMQHDPAMSGLVQPATTPAASEPPAVPQVLGEPAEGAMNSPSSSTMPGVVLAASNNEVAIQFEQSYLLPDGAVLLVSAADGTQMEMVVTAADTGVVMAQVASADMLADGLQGASVEVGVLRR